MDLLRNLSSPHSLLYMAPFLPPNRFQMVISSIRFGPPLAIRDFFDMFRKLILKGAVQETLLGIQWIHDRLRMLAGVAGYASKHQVFELMLLTFLELAIKMFNVVLGGMSEFVRIEAVGTPPLKIV